MSDDILPLNVGRFDCLVIADGDGITRNMLLVRTGAHNILIDTGLGPDWEPVPARLMERLAAAGTPAAAIDVVILSHADWDHIAGAVLANGEPAFPQARYILSRPEGEFWAAQPERLPPSTDYDEDFRRQARTLPVTRLEQLGARVEQVDAGVEIVPGIRLLAAFGHTPGHLVIAVSSEGQQLLHVADLLVEDPTVLEDPDWVSPFDFDPKKAQVTRHSVLAQAAENHTLLLAYHVPFPGLGYVQPQGPGWRWQAFVPPQ
jgi:glyoxylase-like metal-dependent hydrolase (beta-lactamase superfamily II)